jgi:hypothetical protein
MLMEGRGESRGANMLTEIERKVNENQANGEKIWIDEG